MSTVTDARVDVYDPQIARIGSDRDKASVLLVDGKIGRIGKIDHAAVEALGQELDGIDAEGCLIVPGLMVAGGASDE